MKRLLVAILITSCSKISAQKTDTLTILFQPDQYSLSSLDEAKIDSFINEKWDYLSIRGHTDISSSIAHNLGLSKKRALSVYKYVTAHKKNTTNISVSYFGKNEVRYFTNTVSYRNRRVEIVEFNDTSHAKLADAPPKPNDKNHSIFSELTLKDLLANAIFFLLDLVLTLIFIPVVLTLMKRKKINHLTQQTLTAVNELMEIGGSVMIKFNDAAIRTYGILQEIKQMPVAEKNKLGLDANRIAVLQNENTAWFQEISQNYETVLNSFRSTIELFSPHFEDGELLILISNLNQNAQHVLGSMKAIAMSLRVGGNIPNDVFGQINSAYKKMYDLVVDAAKKKKFSLLNSPKTIEVLYELLKDG